MIKFIKKYWLFILMPFILIGFVGGYSYYKIIQNKGNDISMFYDDNDDKEKDLLSDDVFGELKPDDLYNDLRIDAEAKGYITDELISHAIKIVINSMSRSDGSVDVGVKKTDKQHVDMYFAWHNDDKTETSSKEYKISIENNI